MTSPALALSVLTAVVGGDACPETPFERAGVELLSWLCLAEFQAQPMGFSITQGADIWGYTSPSGREYAIVAFDGATGFVEITDPRNPEILDIERHLGAPRVWSDVKTYDHYAYVVTDGDGGGVQILDLDGIDLGVVTSIGTYTGSVAGGFETAHNVAIDEASGTMFSIATGSGPESTAGFDMADLSIDPTSPTHLTRWGDRDVHDMQVVTWEEGPHAGKQIAFLATENDGLAVLDVTGGVVSPLVMDLTYPGIIFCHQCWISADRRFCFVNDEIDEVVGTVSVTTTSVFDISDLDDVTYFGQFTSGRPSSDHNLVVRGDVLFEANYRSGLRVFDVSDMSSPRRIHEIGFFDTFPGSDSAGWFGAWGVYAGFESGVVILSDTDRGLFVLDPVGAIPAYEDVTVAPLDVAAASPGAAWCDIEEDGDVDLLVTADGVGDRLLRNDGGTFADVTPSSLATPGASRGAAWGDADGDGDADLYVARADGPNRYFRNDGGSLVDVTAPPLDDPAESRGVSWADPDRDGDLDLFVANWNAPSRLLRNDGDAFVDTGAFARAGIATDVAAAGAWADYDDDGDVDLAIARGALPNWLLRNAGDGTFTAIPVDGNLPGAMSLGVTWGDGDADGDFDLYFANMGKRDLEPERDTYLRNDDGVFTDATSEVALAENERTFGAAWVDADRDGWLDLVRSGPGLGVRLLRSVRGERFLPAPATNFPDAGDVSGFALADVDGDGGVDLYAPSAGGANHLYRQSGNDAHHWLAIVLEGVISNTHGIGARIEVWADGRVQLRQIEAGSGYLAQHAPIAYVGLDTAAIADSIRVRWPSGWRSRLVDVAADQRLTLNELDATPIDDAFDSPPSPEAPPVTRLHAAAPNPFNAGTRLAFEMGVPARANLSIYDAAGRRVRTLLHGEVRGSGRHAVRWDGRDDAGRPLGSGTYFYRLASGGVAETRRATLVR